MSETVTAPADLASGKGYHDENFPVASFLIAQRFRPPVMAFYDFVRLADDVADHPGVPPDDKLRLLEEMRATLTGGGDAVGEGVRLRQALSARGLRADHACDLLKAFARDCTKTRYADWDELIDYCRYSAMPVGRFVLDVHGESRALWPLSDALCAALQIINHLQDCAKDYRTLDRVYLPLDRLAAAGACVEMLAESRSPRPLRAVLTELARKNAELLARAAPFAAHIRNARLRLEVGVIQTLAESLNLRLISYDPLFQRVHHGKVEIGALFFKAIARFLDARVRSKRQPI
jgi:hydroxysqualene synthase